MAFLLGIEFKRAFAAIVLGVFIAGVIVTSLTVIGWWGAVIAGVGFAVLVVVTYLRRRRELSPGGEGAKEVADEI